MYRLALYAGINYRNNYDDDRNISVKVEENREETCDR